MKKAKSAVSLLLILMMMLSMITVGIVQTAAEETEPYPIPLLGDVNRNGYVDVNDVFELKCSLSRRSGYIRYFTMSPDQLEFRIANVYRDDEAIGLDPAVDVNDLNLLSAFVARRKEARNKGIGERIPLDPEPTEPAPTTPAPEPTEPAPQPTEPTPTTPAPQPTTAEPTTAAEKATVTLHGFDGETETREFNVGDTFTVYSYLNTALIDDGKIASLDCEQDYTASILSLNDEWDPNDNGMIVDLEKVFPVTGDDTISNASKTGRIIFNSSKARGYSFKAADAKLIVTDYTVIAPGEADIETKVKILARTGPEVEKIVHKGVVQPGFVFVQHTTFDPNYTVSYDIQPTEPAPTTPAPEPTEPAPTTPAPTIPAPQPTTAEPTTAEPTTTAEKATVTLHGFDGEIETREFNVGDTFTVYSYLNTALIDGGKIASLACEQDYTASILSLNDEWDPNDDGMIVNLEKVFPVTGDSTISNASKTGRIIFNASKARGYSFKATDAKLIVTDYTVTAPGNADIEMKINIITRTGPEVEKIVNKGVVQPEFVFVQHTTFDPNYTVSYYIQPTEPTPTDHAHTPATIVRENEVPATCTAEGSYDEVVYCSACGEEISRTHKTIAKLAHNLIYVAEVPATYEAEGVKAHYECIVCHKLFADATGAVEVTGESLIIPKLTPQPTTAEPTTVQPTTPAPTTPAPTTPAPTTPAPTTPAPTTPAPQPTTAEPTTAAEKATVTLHGFDGETETREFNVGDTFTVYSYLNTALIDDGKLASLDCEQDYTASILSLNDEWDPNDDGMIVDLEKVFPVTGDDTMSNASKAGRIIFNSSKARGYSFKAADAKLIVTDYTVIAPGEADIETKVKILARTGPDVEKIVNKYVVQPGFVFVQHTTFDPNYTVSYDVQPTEAEPTEPAPTEPAPQPTDPAPTEHTHTPATIVRENEVPATCTAEGSYDEVVYCSTCGEEISRTHKTIAKLAHNLTYVAEVPATYEAEGMKAHYICSVCHKLFADATGAVEVTGESLIIPKLTPQPTTAEPTTVQPTTPAPTTPAPTTPAPQPTTAEPTTVVEKATVTLRGFDGETETKEFNVGDTFTVYAYLNTSAIDDGMIASLDAELDYPASILSLNDEWDPNDNGMIVDLEKVFPITGDDTMSNASKAGRIIFNASKARGYSFKAGDSKLIVAHFTVDAVGEADVELKLDTLTRTGSDVEKIIDKGVLQSGFSLIQHTSFESTYTIPEHVHTASAAVRENEVPATCTAAGSYDEVVYCSDCGFELSRTTKTIAKLAHTASAAVRENEVPATCTAAGSYDEVVYCSVCHTEMSRTSKTIAKLAHTASAAVRENEVPATCTAAGSYDEVVYCSVCHTEMSRTAKTIPMTAHTLTYVAEVPATTSAEGAKAHYTCSVCGKLFSDATGSVEVTAAELVIPKLTEGQKIYLKPGEWANDNARLAVWVSGWKNYTSEWYDLEPVGNGIYVADVGSTAWASCKFARFDPATTGYDSAWNTSSEVGFQAGYLYTIPSGEWNNAVPTSALYNPDATEPTTPEPTQSSDNDVTFEPGDASRDDPAWFAWVWNDSSEGQWIAGTASGSDVVFPGAAAYGNILVVRMPNGSTSADWNTCWNQSEDVTVQAGKTLYFSGWGSGSGSKFTIAWK